MVAIFAQQVAAEGSLSAWVQWQMQIASQINVTKTWVAKFGGDPGHAKKKGAYFCSLAHKMAYCLSS